MVGDPHAVPGAAPGEERLRANEHVGRRKGAIEPERAVAVGARPRADGGDEEQPVVILHRTVGCDASREAKDLREVAVPRGQQIRQVHGRTVMCGPCCASGSSAPA